MPTSFEPAQVAEEQEDRFRKLVESAPDGIVISRDAIVLYANPAALLLLGYEKASDLVGQSMGAFLDHAALAAMGARLKKIRETGHSLPPLEYSAKRRDGSVVTVEISSIFVDFDGAPAVLAFARDVTERARLRAQLAHADRLASLGVMAAGVAHEINNPLAFVMLAADLLEREPPAGSGESSRELVHNIRTGVRRIAAIVRDLRSFGQYEDEAPKAVDLAAVFESAISITAHEVRHRARLTRDHGVLPAVLGVPTRLEQVFVNLLLNAAHAIPEGRTDGEIVISARAREADVLVEVIDNGVGIRPDILPRIFDPFITTKPAGAGIGLGLSICRDIVARWGGRIEASSEPGSGATLRVILPLATRALRADVLAALGAVAAEPPAAASPGEHPKGWDVPGSSPVGAPGEHPKGWDFPGASDDPPSGIQTIGPRRRILVIDDEPATVAMVTAVLREAHDVVGVSDSSAGLEHILSGPTFDVIVCDLMMPGLTGMDLYEKVARERPGLERRIVFMTGGAYTERARSFLDRVANHRVMKPLSAATLATLVVPGDPKAAAGTDAPS